MTGTVTQWKYKFHERLRTQGGDAGTVVSRSESLSRNGVPKRHYRLECTSEEWNDIRFVWTPEDSVELDS